jgi:hypothetical protein
MVLIVKVPTEATVHERSKSLAEFLFLSLFGPGDENQPFFWTDGHLFALSWRSFISCVRLLGMVPVADVPPFFPPCPINPLTILLCYSIEAVVALLVESS